MVNSGNEILVVYTLNNTLRYKIYREDIRFGVPSILAIGESVPITPQGVNVTTDTKPYAYPCPWRSDRHTGSNIKFSHLPPNSSVKIYTISAQFVVELSNGVWDLKNSHGSGVASGVYLYLVSDGAGFNSSGKLVVIK